MIAGPPPDRERHFSRWWLRAAALLLVPAIVLGFGWLTAPGRVGSPFDGQSAESASRSISRWFGEELATTLRVAENALRTSPDSAASTRSRSSFASRLEGVGVLDENDRFLQWNGSAPEPPVEGWSPREALWEIRVEGLRTRLIVRSAQTSDGRSAIASFVLESPSHGDPFAGRIPDRFLVGLHARVHFSDRYAAGDVEAPLGPTPAGASIAILRSPAGDPLGTVTLSPIDRDHRRAIHRTRTLALATLLAVGLLVIAFPWRRMCRHGPGLLACLSAIAVARLLLLRTGTPALWLPEKLGTASFFGASGYWGLLASPADLVLSGLAAYLAAVVLSRYVWASRRPIAPWIALSSAIAFSFAVWAIAVSIVENAREPWVSRLLPRTFETSSVLLLGSLFAILGAAELWSTAVGRIRGNRRPPRTHVALALIAIVAVFAVVQQERWQTMNVERLQSELAPQLLEQGSRREAALEAIVRQVRDAFDGFGDPESRNVSAEYLAYHFWSRSALFYGGYRSSLDFFTPAGDLLSHFAFDLPGFDEMPRLAVEPGDRFDSLEAWRPGFAIEETVLHSEAIVGPLDEPIGIVVGHVIDEPDNLPILPGARSYLSMLGPGAPSPIGDSLPEGPHYVLYDADGRVVLSTLVEPPTDPGPLRALAEPGQTVKVLSGAVSYIGIALLDAGRVHVLLIPDWTLLERLAIVVRMSLIGLALLLLLSLTPFAGRRRSWKDLVSILGRSFHRKLLAALIVASTLPLLGLALFLQNYIERRGNTDVENTAIRVAHAAQRVLEDYAASVDGDPDADGVEFNDQILFWLRRIVGQEIHVFERGQLVASSKRELYDSGLFPRRLDGQVQRGLVDEGRPHLVVPTVMYTESIPVAYTSLLRADRPERELVAGIPIAERPRQIARSVEEIGEFILLATVLLVVLLSLVAARLARTVARPVRELVEATAKIAAGDYDTRLVSRSRDEVASLVHGFNSMAASLSAQREDLERRREYMERLLRHATTGVISTDPAGIVVTLNPTALDLLGAATERLRIGASLPEVIAEIDELRPLADVLLEGGYRPGEPREIDLGEGDDAIRLRIVRLDLPDPSGSDGSLILLDDVTDLMRSNQLAAWTEMARAIAHEIKNPLTPIQLSTEHLRRLLQDRGILPSPELEACLDTVFKQVRTLHEIAGEFSAYATLPSLSLEPRDPVEFLKETLAPYRSAMPVAIALEERYEPCGAVAIDAKVLSRAIVNLIENAFQAMPDGGRLTVGAAPVTEGEGVELLVQDTGTGLSPEARERIFELYFSTKSSGSGIGLAIVRRAVEAHRGTIDFDSRPGSGTSFRIRLPRDVSDASA